MSSPNIREGARVPLLLLIPLVVVVAVLGYLLLLPLSLLQRYRAGRARRRAQAWLIGANAWLLLVSTTGFLLGAWLGERWIPGALREAVLGLLAGLLLGLVGLAATHYEHDARGWFYTPNRWLVLGLTLIVAGRIGYGIWTTWRWAHAGVARSEWLAEQGGLLIAGGVLLGYYLAYLWGLRARVRRR